MSETIQSISNGTYTIGNTNELTFSAGPGISIDSPSEGVVRIGNDETVLWSGDKTGTGTITLSEGVNNFESIAVYISSEGVGITAPQKFESLVNFDYGRFVIRYGGELSKSLVAAENSIYIWGGELVVYNTSYTTLNVGRTNRVHVSSITTVIDHSPLTHICKVIGINRISNA